MGGHRSHLFLLLGETSLPLGIWHLVGSSGPPRSGQEHSAYPVAELGQVIIF